MLRALFGIYTLGIVVVFLLLLFMRPAMPLIEAVLTSLIWPYGVYLLIVDKVDVKIKSSLQWLDPHIAIAFAAAWRERD